MKVWVGLVKKWVLRQIFEILPSNLIKKKKLLSAKRLIKFLKKIFKQIYRAVAHLKLPGDNNAVMEKQCFFCPRKNYASEKWMYLNMLFCHCICVCLCDVCGVCVSVCAYKEKQRKIYRTHKHPFKLIS